MHPILVRSSSKYALSPGSFGMADTTNLSMSGVFPVIGAMSSYLPASESISQSSFANPDNIAQILTFLSLTRSYPRARALVYTRKQESKKRRRKEGGEGFGWYEEASYWFPPLVRPSRRSRPVPGTRDPPSQLVHGLAIIAQIGSHESGSRSVH